MRCGEAVVDVVAAVYPSCLNVGEPAVADQMTEEFAEALTPQLRKLLFYDGAAATSRCREHRHLHRERPVGIVGQRGAVVQQHLTLCGERLAGGNQPRFSVQRRWFGVQRSW